MFGYWKQNLCIHKIQPKCNIRCSCWVRNCYCLKHFRNWGLKFRLWCCVLCFAKSGMYYPPFNGICCLCLQKTCCPLPCRSVIIRNARVSILTKPLSKPLISHPKFEIHQFAAVRECWFSTSRAILHICSSSPSAIQNMSNAAKTYLEISIRVTGR